jgi:hypothetical protein
VLAANMSTSERAPKRCLANCAGRHEGSALSGIRGNISYLMDALDSPDVFHEI